MSNPTETPNPLDDRRQRVYDALQERSPEFAGYYRAAIVTLLTPADPGEQRAKVSSVCHSFREIMNGLPHVMGENSSPFVIPSSVQLIAELPDMRLDLAGDEEVVTLSRDLATSLDEVLRTATLENARVADDIASLLAGEKQVGHPLVRPWKKTRSFFVGWAHWDRPGDESRPIPSDADLESHIRIVEDIIESRAGAFFDTRHTIDDLLADANQVVEEEAE